MTDGQKLDRLPEPDVLSPADAAMVARLCDFGDVAVHPFDAAGIVALATAGPSGGHVRLGGSLQVPTLPTRSAWVFISVLLVVVLATIIVLAGSSRERPSFVQTPPIPPTTTPSELAVAPIKTPGPSSSPVAPGPAVLGPGRVTYTVDGDVYVADIDGGGAEKILTGGSAPYDDPRWAADGRISVTRSAGDDQTPALDVDLTDASGTTPAKVGYVIRGQGNRYHSWSPDGTRLAILDRTSITIVGGDAPITLSPPAGERWDVSDVVTFGWSPDGTALLAGACQPDEGTRCSKSAAIRLMLVPVDGSPPHELASYADPTWDATFSPDGTRIAFIDSQSNGFRLEVMAADGTGRRVLVPPIAEGSWTAGLTFAWSPDGRSIAYHHAADDGNGLSVGDGLWVIAVDSNDPPRHVTPDTGIFDVRAWSPDGRWLLVAAFEGDASQLELVDVELGESRVVAKGAQDGDWIWGDASPKPSASVAPSARPSDAGRGIGGGLVYLQRTTVIAADPDGAHPRVLASDVHLPSIADSTPDFDALEVSPDGNVIAYDGPGSVELVTTSGRHVGTIGVESPSRADRMGVTWAPDSQRLAVYRDVQPDRLAIVRPDGKETGSIRLPDGFVAGRQGPPWLAWSPDGRWIGITGCVELCPGVSEGLTQDDILLVAADGSGWHWLNDRTARLDPLPVGGNDAWADWSQDSRLAVSRVCNLRDPWCDEASYPKLQITGPDDGGGQQVHVDGPGHVAWSPDGQRVAIAFWGPGGPSLSIAEPDGSFNSVGGISAVHGPGAIHWGQDGNSILVSGNRSIWSVPLTGEPASEIVQNAEEWFAVGPTH